MNVPIVVIRRSVNRPSGPPVTRDQLRRIGMVLVTGLIAIFAITACTSVSKDNSDAAKNGASKNAALQPHVYNPVNNIEFDNYNKRQRIADNPTTILWCTAYPANINARPITVPIVGKLTSSNKRPYATTQVQDYQGDATTYTYSQEKPGPDGMFGASTEYRYGFDPSGTYWDFTDLETVCTTEPTTYQAQSTTIINKTDPTMQAANLAAQAALKAGHPDEAQKILDDAAAKVGNK